LPADSFSWPFGYTELKKLKELRDSGVITEEKFQVQKKKLLEKH
jgi:Short C-terminal domain